MDSIFTNLNPAFNIGMKDFLKKHFHFSEIKDLKISVLRSDDNKIKITKSKNEITFEINKDHQIFRCLTNLKSHLYKKLFNGRNRLF